MHSNPIKLKQSRNTFTNNEQTIFPFLRCSSLRNLITYFLCSNGKKQEKKKNEQKLHPFNLVLEEKDNMYSRLISSEGGG